MDPVRDLFSHRPYWAHRLGPAPFLPISREEMETLGWDACDVVLVTGDAYVDHPSFGAALVGRLLEAQGFRVGVIAQPDWHSALPFQALGRPRLFFGVTAGNMDSMVNRYTADRRLRSDDAYTPGGAGGRRPDRAVIVYAQRCREAYREVPIVLGGIEASLRRIAHYDYWSDQVRRSVLLDARADLLVFGNAERAVVDLAHRLAAGEPIGAITDLRGTACVRRGLPEGWRELDSTRVDRPGPVQAPPSPYGHTAGSGVCAEAPVTDGPAAAPVGTPGRSGYIRDGGRDGPPPVANQFAPTGAGTGGVASEFAPRGAGSRGVANEFGPTGGRTGGARMPGERTVVRLPAYEEVARDPVLYAHASRVLHLESNPGNARALVQRHGDRDVWLNPPPVPLTTREMDRVYELPYARRPHPAYGAARIPAYEMIRFSVTILRGCFGGCTFCSITEHEGRIIQSRSEASVLREVETVRDTVPGFTGVVSDLGGPTANMYRLACKSREIERACRRLSCVFPTICKNLGTDHGPLVRLYRRARALPGIKKVLVASGVRYDLAIESPEYVRELVTHHVGGYLKIAPEHVQSGPLALMMKPGVDTYERFKALFDRYSREAGKEQYLIPYFIAAHPGTTDQDMLELALWLKRNGFRADQVQAFLPSPMALATAMYHTGRNPLHRVDRDSAPVYVPRGGRQRRLHKAFLRYHDPENWPLLREALRRMGRADLIGNGKRHLVPAWQPAGTGERPEGVRGRPFATRHDSLPRVPGGEPPARHRNRPRAGPRGPGRDLHPGSPTGQGKRRGR
jgi:uncharacterized radical SAM protein YgiQ